MIKYTQVVQISREIICEVIGVFMLNFLCPYGILQLSGELAPGLSSLGPTIGVFGFLTTYIPLFAFISGSHFNPLFSVLFYLLGCKSLPMIILFMGVHMIASLLSAMLLQATFIKGFEDQGIPYPKLNPKVSVELGFFIEALGAFLLTNLVTVSFKSGAHVKVTAFRVALLVAFLIHTLGPFTGIAMNPAVVFGPALLDKDGFFQRGWWIYYIAPFVGGIPGYYVGVFLDQGKEELQALEKTSAKLGLSSEEETLEVSLSQ